MKTDTYRFLERKLQTEGYGEVCAYIGEINSIALLRKCTHALLELLEECEEKNG